jgi:integrase
MKPIEMKDGRWRVFVPRKLSKLGKREIRNFASKSAADKFIKDFKAETREHGRSGVTSTDREWIAFARNELGDLSQLPEVIRFWKRNGERLEPIETTEAVKTFTEAVRRDYGNARTRNDIIERLEQFSNHFGAKPVHEISATDVERYLETFASGWNRWSVHKRLRPFFKLALRRKWCAVDPMSDIPTPKTPVPERQIYSVQQFQDMLTIAETLYPSLVSYMVLSGFCFLRTAELVRMYANEKILRWEHVLWDDGLIHVPHGVAKGTKRADGDERYIPLNDAAKRWLEPIRKAEGDCVEHSASKFGQVWRDMLKDSRVEPIENGLRHSAISYALAANPEYGVALVSQWAGNSEKTIRKHYRKLVKPELGKAWFNVQQF